MNGRFGSSKGLATIALITTNFNCSTESHAKLLWDKKYFFFDKVQLIIYQHVSNDMKEQNPGAM